MDELPVRVKILRPEARLPFYASAGAAGADLSACLPEAAVLEPGERISVPTGLALETSESGYAALIFARSGPAAARGLALTNGVGVVDEDYRGEICLLLVNLGQETIILSPGERLAQVVFVPVRRGLFRVEEDLGVTERGNGGFGSTGRL
ncbi:MAG: dUTP diphosphatase [Gracilibacteraceae bacterium]|jgi:dUTP pyrophosphatase|nr:dUTP diphosphatase [Gracilibacteraceae bacterium]